MVDKVDRPEAPAPWKIKEPARTKDDRRSRQQEESKEQKKEKFEKRSEGGWQKFDSRTMIIKSVRVPLRDIKGFRFCSVMMHSGVATMEADMEWSTGRMTEGAMVRLGSFDDYIKAKRLQLGDLVPREMWAKNDPVEVGIPQARGPSGAFSMKELEQESRRTKEKKGEIKRSWLATMGLKNKRTGQFQWSMLILYIIIATGLGLAIHALLTMTRL